VHEDNDILGVFSLEEYNQWGPGKAARWFLGYFTAIGTFAGGIYYFAYPQKPGVKRDFPNGLETELGGPRAMIVSFPTSVLRP
jgi:NADH dehydrogenase (ubiquinone) 1 beta subcomplex subunit 8